MSTSSLRIAPPHITRPCDFYAAELGLFGLGPRVVSARKPSERDAGIDAELVEDMAQVGVDVVRRNEEALGALAIAHPVSDQPRDRELRIGHGRPASAWALRGNQAAAHTQCPKPAAHPAGVPHRTGPRIEQ